MTKTIFSRNEMVAHVWGQQTQDEGRSPTPSGEGGYFRSSGRESATESRVSFKGRVFYSYREPVARLEPNGSGALCLLYTSRTWSPSTSGHVKDAIGAVSHLIGAEDRSRGRAFKVPHIGGHYGSPGEWRGEPAAIDHVRNVQYLAEQYRDAVALYEGRAKIHCDYIPGVPYDAPGPHYYTESQTVERRLRDAWAAALDYIDSFLSHDPNARALLGPDFPLTFAEVDAVAARIMAEREARAARALAKLTPAEVARRAAAKADRAAKAEEARRLQFADAADKLAGWQRGLNIRFGVPRSDAAGNAYIRASGVKRDKGGQVTGGRLETSQGASAPLVQAIRVFQFIKCVRESGEAWEPRGLHGIRVGDFTLSRIEPDGSFRAGCHSFAWPEIERLAAELGVEMLPCNRAAVTE